MIPYVKIVIVLTLAVCLISGAYASTITTSAKGDSVITSDSLLNVQTDESNVDTIAHASSSLLNGEVEYAKSLNTVTGETESAYVAKKTSLIYDAQMTTNINKEKSNLCSMSSTDKAPKATVKSSTQTSNLIGDNIDMYVSGKPSTSYSVDMKGKNAIGETTHDESDCNSLGTCNKTTSRVSALGNISIKRVISLK